MGLKIWISMGKLELPWYQGKWKKNWKKSGRQPARGVDLIPVDRQGSKWLQTKNSAMELNVSRRASNRLQTWTCAACNNKFSQQTKKHRHLRHCSGIQAELRKNLSDQDTKQLITHYVELMSKEKLRCTCRAEGYAFCASIVADINWNADLTLVQVTEGLRKLKYARYAFLPPLVTRSLRWHLIASLSQQDILGRKVWLF